MSSDCYAGGNPEKIQRQRPDSARQSDFARRQAGWEEICLARKELFYSGRIDITNPKKPEFVFPASSLHFRFYGKRAALTVYNRGGEDWRYFAGAVVDGVQKCFELPPNDRAELVLADGEEKEHEILFFKRQDSCHEMVLERLSLSDGSVLLDLPEPALRRIEVYGDSVSVGEVSEAVDYLGEKDPEHTGEYTNSWYSYAWIAARKLGAQIHNISQSGIPLLNGSGWVMPPYLPGMESVWDKLHYHPQWKRVSKWDFSRYTPHLVLIAIGQNDSNPEDYMKTNPEGAKAVKWRCAYRKLVQDIRKQYPEAVIILTTTILEHDENWDKAIGQVCGELGDNRIRHFLYRKNGCGTKGHVRIPEAEEMAEELVHYIEELDIPVWVK